MDTRDQIIKFIEKTGALSPGELSGQLGISRQAVHRHLKALEAAGKLEKVGAGAHSKYQLASDRQKLTKVEIVENVGRILGELPDVRLITLFGSRSRGDAVAKSDVDLMVWLASDTTRDRRDVWSFWDEHAAALWWKDLASIVVKKFGSEIQLHTLLLDLPEEHTVVFDPDHIFPRLRTAILEWRSQNGAAKLPSFGGTHAWRYSDQAKTLDEIDFTLRIKGVA